MEDSTAMAPEEIDGPFVTAAFFCERVLHEKDEVLSAMRIMDVLTLTGPGPFPGEPGGPEHIVYPLMALVMVRNGRGAGPAQLELRQFRANGQLGNVVPQAIEFGTPDQPTRIIQNVRLLITQQGLLWTEVRVDGRLLTRMPLRLIFQKTNEIPVESR